MWVVTWSVLPPTTIRATRLIFLGCEMPKLYRDLHTNDRYVFDDNPCDKDHFSWLRNFIATVTRTIAMLFAHFLLSPTTIRATRVIFFGCEI